MLPFCSFYTFLKIIHFFLLSGISWFTSRVCRKITPLDFHICRFKQSWRLLTHTRYSLRTHKGSVIVSSRIEHVRECAIFSLLIGISELIYNYRTSLVHFNASLKLLAPALDFCLIFGAGFRCQSYNWSETV